MTRARVGLDIGGTKTAGGLVLFPDGVVLEHRVIPTRPNRDGHEVLQDVVDLASDVIREAAVMGHEVEGIGAGVAELVTGDGEIASSQCVPWRGLPVRQGAAALRLALPQILSMLSDNLSPRVVRLIQDLAEDWRYLA